jgi:hypothetical protein
MTKPLTDVDLRRRAVTLWLDAVGVAGRFRARRAINYIARDTSDAAAQVAADYGPNHTVVACFPIARDGDDA